MPGFASALSATLSDLRAEKVGSEVLRTLGAPGKDLAVLLDLFGEELRTQRLADLWELFALATDSAHSAGSPLVGKPLAFLDLGIQSAVAKQFLSKLVDAAPSVLATVPHGDWQGKRFWEGLLGIGSERPSQCDSPQLSLHRIRSRIFETGENPATVQDGS